MTTLREKLKLESGGVGFCALKAAFDTTTAHYHRT